MGQKPPKTLLLVPTEMERKVLNRLHKPLQPKPLLCGFGPIVAAARAAQLITKNRPERVLLLGIAGTYQKRLAVGSAYLFDQVGCYGVGIGSGNQFQTASAVGWCQWLSADTHKSIGDTVGLEVPSGVRTDALAGLLLTVTAAAAADRDCQDRLASYPAATAEDMEAFGIAVACRLSGVPLTVIRGISNHAGNRDKDLWQIDEAMQSAAALVSELLTDGAP